MAEPVAAVAPTQRERPNFARFSDARNSKRQLTRELIHARVVHPIDTPRLLHDPLERRDSRAMSALAAIRLVIAAIVIHAGVVVSLALVGHLLGEQRTYRPPERLTVKIVETPPPPPAVIEEPPVQPGPIVPEFAPATPAKTHDEPVKQPRKARDAPEPTTTPEPNPVPRRIVGSISRLES